MADEILEKIRQIRKDGKMSIDEQTKASEKPNPCRLCGSTRLLINPAGENIFGYYCSGCKIQSSVVGSIKKVISHWNTLNPIDEDPNIYGHGVKVEFPNSKSCDNDPQKLWIDSNDNYLAIQVNSRSPDNYKSLLSSIESMYYSITLEITNFWVKTHEGGNGDNSYFNELHSIFKQVEGLRNRIMSSGKRFEWGMEEKDRSNG
jgi:hypothetical protein